MADGGWIKLYRVLLDDDLWIDCTPVQKVVMITLLLMANHKERKWIWQGKKFVAKPGQMVTSLESIKGESGKGVSIRAVRTSLAKFETVGFLTSKSTNSGRLITVVNWAKYQSSIEEVTNELTSNRQATDKQLTTNKNVKNDKNERKSSRKADTELTSWSRWQKIWGFPNAIAQQDLMTWIDEFGDDLVTWVIEYAARRDVQNRSADKYLERVFDGYRKQGINTVQQAEAAAKEHAEVARASAPRTQQARYGKPLRQEAVPEWMQAGYHPPKQEVSAEDKAELAEKLKELEQLRSRNATSS
ncbi:DnaD domain protein [Lacticaseibacillus sp. 866-1]|uniref:DnaD domain-containing protein n=1 Tax=Lacticaseibacillus sp. 866-1 TaxID=2799576 RepID=UPI0019456FB0|nr:DnaD domain protein [Lacticaseibacillus sp. 866-1]